MPSARYAPLANPRSVLDAEREMDDAFDDDADDFHAETTPLNVSHAPSGPSPHPPPPPATGTYDFERDYDYPPPGSPPAPSSSALPDNAIGNSNGLLPTSPVVPAAPPRLSLFRRAVNSFLPSHYQRLPPQPQAPGNGSGIGNDGVFANVMAKPSRPAVVHTDDGEAYVVPEDTQAEAPPSYAAASADAVPPYWETTVHAPPPINLNGDMIIDEMPTGPFVTFVFTTLVSWFFQFPGFLLTYLLHGTHAGRFGSQAGLALTLIQFGFSATVSRGLGAEDGDGGNGAGIIVTPGDDAAAAQPSSSPSVPSSDIASAAELQNSMYGAGREWISFLLMTIGWFLLLTSIIGYVRVKRFEMSIRAAHAQGASPEDLHRDVALRRNIEEIFGITIRRAEDPESPLPPPPPPPPRDEREVRILQEEARLERDLRAAGLL